MGAKENKMPPTKSMRIVVQLLDGAGGGQEIVKTIDSFPDTNPHLILLTEEWSLECRLVAAPTHKRTTPSEDA
jgi:hypothetical protein